MKTLDPSPEVRAFAAATLQEHGPALHRYLLRRIANREDVSDLIQEVYLRLLRVSDVELVRSPLAYVFGVAGHVVSEFNLRHRQSRLVYDSSLADTVSESTEWDQSESGGFFEQQVREALRKLPPNQLAVLLLERREGLSHAEIAEKLGLSVHTVKKYSVQALAQIRAGLDR